MDGKFDINHSKACLDGEKMRIQESGEITPENKALISDFFDYSKARRTTYAEGTELKDAKALRKIAEHFGKKPFAKASQEDLENLIAWTFTEKNNDGKPTSPYTKANHRATIKAFFRFLGAKTGAVYKVDALRSSYPDPFKMPTKYTPGQIPTRKSVLAATVYCKTLRDKAVLLVHYFSGGRAGDTLRLQRKDVLFNDSVVTLNFYERKTGQVTENLPLGEPACVKALRDYAKTLPEDPEVYFWSGKRDKPMSRAWFGWLMKTVGKKAGIAVSNPHAFRNGRVTELLASGEISQTQANIFFGWKPGSQQGLAYCRSIPKEVMDKIIAHDQAGAEIEPNPEELQRLANKVNALETQLSELRSTIILEQFHESQKFFSEFKVPALRTLEETPNMIYDLEIREFVNLGVTSENISGGVVGTPLKNWNFVTPSDRELVMLKLWNLKKRKSEPSQVTSRVGLSISKPNQEVTCYE